jgi:UDPglucose--hexose-1-phosphate uridylyltransferase
MDERFLIRSPHRRLNALTGEWVFVSPQRDQRPWQGRHEQASRTTRPAYEPGCYLCPGNARANGQSNPAYTSTYVFSNDFPAFLPDIEATGADRDTLMRAHAQSGTCRVLCYSPRHDLTLAQMSAAQIRAVIDTWAAQVTELGSRWQWVQIFENQGELMGCSNPHPHGQIWASDFTPNEPAKELRQQQQWLEGNATPLLLDYAVRESSARERLVLENHDWLVVVPWWAVWPFETLLLPRGAVQQLPALRNSERQSLADILCRLLAGYDRLFHTPFPYSFGWHGAPTGGDALSTAFAACQLHAHFYPPLLRSATVKKFMVGYEMLAETQRDITPEQAADRLRRCMPPVPTGSSVAGRQ